MFCTLRPSPEDSGRHRRRTSFFSSLWPPPSPSRQLTWTPSEAPESRHLTQVSVSVLSQKSKKSLGPPRGGDAAVLPEEVSFLETVEEEEEEPKTASFFLSPSRAPRARPRASGGEERKASKATAQSWSQRSNRCCEKRKKKEREENLRQPHLETRTCSSPASIDAQLAVCSSISSVSGSVSIAVEGHASIYRQTQKSSRHGWGEVQKTDRDSGCEHRATETLRSFFFSSFLAFRSYLVIEASSFFPRGCKLEKTSVTCCLLAHGCHVCRHGG